MLVEGRLELCCSILGRRLQLILLDGGHAVLDCESIDRESIGTSQLLNRRLQKDLAVLVHFLIHDFLRFLPRHQLRNLARAVFDLGIVVDFFDLKFHFKPRKRQLARLPERRTFLLANDLRLLLLDAQDLLFN